MRKITSLGGKINNALMDKGISQGEFCRQTGISAIVLITLDNGLAVYGLTVVETDHVFVSFPSEQDKYGKYRDIVHPIDDKTRTLIEGAVLQEYMRVMYSVT